MMDPKLENTIGGGEENQMSEIKLGEATYIVHRSYSDTQSCLLYTSDAADE